METADSPGRNTPACSIGFIKGWFSMRSVDIEITQQNAYIHDIHKEIPYFCHRGVGSDYMWHKGLLQEVMTTSNDYKTQWPTFLWMYSFRSKLSSLRISIRLM